MAKRKSKKKSFVKYLPFVILVLGVASFAMLFLDALKYSDDYFVKGTAAVFGEKRTFLGQTIENKFSFLGLLAFVLPLIAGIVAIIPVSKKANQIKFLVSALLAIIGCLLLFIMPSYIKVAYDTILSSGTVDIDFSLAIGTILGGVFAGLTGVTSLSCLVLK